MLILALQPLDPELPFILLTCTRQEACPNGRTAPLQLDPARGRTCACSWTARWWRSSQLRTCLSLVLEPHTSVYQLGVGTA